MASIVQRNNRYCVVYLYDDETSGRRRQKWESFRTVAEMLIDWKREQDFTKEALGSEYSDFDLVMANDLGMPTEQSRITCFIPN